MIDYINRGEVATSWEYDRPNRLLMIWDGGIVQQNCSLSCENGGSTVQLPFNHQGREIGRFFMCSMDRRESRTMKALVNVGCPLVNEQNSWKSTCFRRKSTNYMAMFNSKLLNYCGKCAMARSIWGLDALPWGYCIMICRYFYNPTYIYIYICIYIYISYLY